MNKKDKKPFIAALLCLTIFPGVGQYYLGFKKLAVGIMATSVVALSVIMQKIYVIAKHIAEKIVTGEVSGDITKIQALIHTQLEQSSNTAISVASSLLFLCWIGSAALCLCYKKRD